MSRRATALALALLSASALVAHPEIEEALTRLNTLIEATPTDAALYLERGELYAKHADWLTAEANYLRATELAPDLPRLALARGALALATAQPAVARTHLDRALTLSPSDPEALILRARAFAQLAQPAAALADYDAALPRLPSPSPELYVERSAVCASPVAALRGLEAGLDRLGPVPALVSRVLDLEISLGRTEAALTRLAALATESERPAPWLKRRGDLLASVGRTAEARAAYAAALSAIAALPAWLQKSSDTARLFDELTRLAATP